MEKSLKFGLIGVIAVMLSACGSGDGGIGSVEWEPIEASDSAENKQAGEEETEKIKEDTVQPDADAGSSTKTQADPYVGEYNDRDISEPNLEMSGSNTQESDNINAEMTADELLDLFINGQVNAVSPADPAQAFYITDLHMDSEEWDSYSVGEKVDLDNDGENELIICGPYGGIYLDARDNKIYEFARGEGTGNELSYVVYNGATWIMYSNRMHAEYELFYMEKFEGADNLVAEMDFSREPVDGNNIESGMKYTLNGTEISSDEFAELASKICATEVNTN